MSGAGVVEGRATLQMKRQLAADHTDPPDQFIRHRARTADRHVILDLAHALVVQEAGDEDGGVRPVELLVPEVVAGRGNAETPPLPVVQNCGENARRVEVRQAEPVDRPVHAYQGRRAHVAYDAIVLNGLVCHWCSTLQDWLVLYNTYYSKFTGSTSRNIIYLAFSMDYGSRGKIMEFTRNIST